MALTSKKKMKSIPTLPLEIIIEILSWLPIKNLSPLMFLSKSWFKLLTNDPHFAKLHYNRAIQSNSSNPSILVFRDYPSHSILRTTIDFYLAIEYTDEVIIQLDHPFDESINSYDYSVHGICNGLLCVRYNDIRKVFIWNPLTNDHICLRYDPIRSYAPWVTYSTDFAVGYHRGIDEYKVIKVVNEFGSETSENDEHTHVSLWTLGKDLGWRTLEEDMRYHLWMESSPLVGGVLHWLAHKIESDDMSAVILGLDVKTEFFQEMMPPQDFKLSDPMMHLTIGELGGLLCLYCANHDHQDLQVWAMKEYGVFNSWTKEFKIGRDEFSGFVFNLKPLGVVAQTGEYVLEEHPKELILYNSKDNSFRDLNDFGFKFSNAYCYIGSIISPRAISEGRI